MRLARRKFRLTNSLRSPTWKRTIPIRTSEPPIAAGGRDVTTEELTLTAADGNELMAFAARGEEEGREAPPGARAREVEVEARLEKYEPDIVVVLFIAASAGFAAYEAIRRLADLLLELAPGRMRSVAHEIRWLNLTGFCIRPGFGSAADDWRISELRKVYSAGLAYPKDIQCQVEWLVLWQRTSAGFTAASSQRPNPRPWERAARSSPRRPASNR